MKKAFSLIELMISMIVISCICAAFVPVISKKLSASHVNKVQNAISLPEDVSLKDKITMLEAMRDCRLNKDKTRLICEVELSELKSASNVKRVNESSVKVKYSERRDKIRFDNKEEGNYQVSNVVQTDLQNNKNNVKAVSIPVKETKDDVDETIDADTMNSINELLKLIQTQEISNYK